MVEMVPTDEREDGTERRCSSATAGGMPVTESTCGASTCRNSRRAYGETDSRYRCCASANRVPNASEDFPDPETPVNATTAPRGTATATPRRLCTRAPRTRTMPSSTISVLLTAPRYLGRGRRVGCAARAMVQVTGVWGGE